ncbi:MAG TPA: chemotaxis protein CheW, partial [Planctomycetota bacterium]|nr:chemotaxis protein CheW [Planctomycetota bacterium]
MLRNSIDHGIESPAERVRAGKKVAGKIVLSACHQGNHVLISIQDDGKGMSRKAILNKAVEQGVVSLHEGERMSDADIFDLIFLPGFSTAQSVSNVSGRGVGMDVVKTSIEKLNGSVEISSQIGVGTIFTIRLPLTLAIIHTLQVSVSEQVFAIPITSVIESLRIHSHQIEYIPKTSVIRFREHVIPLVRLSDVFELKESKNESSNMYVVVVGMAERRIGIVVDNIVGQEEVVVKSMGKWLENTPGISSACIGGDGKVTLIIDVAGIFRLLPHSLSLSVHKSEMSVQHPTPPNSTYILLVEDSRSERKRTRLILESQGNFKVMESIDG